MKKVIVFLLVILLVACHPLDESLENKQSLPEELVEIEAKEPPDLMIKYNDTMIKGVQGTTSWSNGLVDYEADSDAPPILVSYQEDDITAFEEDVLELIFEYEPNSYSLVIWHGDDEKEYVDVENGLFELPIKDDYIVYGLSAYFDQGVVQYAFSVHVLKSDPPTSFKEQIIDGQVDFDGKIYDVSLESVISYDYDGLNMIKKSIKDSEGQVHKTIDYRYYNGLNVEEKHYENNELTIVRHSYNGNDLKKSVTLEDDKAILTQVYVYMKSNKETYLYDKDKNILASAKGTYDEFGNFIDYTSYDKDGHVFSSKESTFEDGTLISSKYISEFSKSYHLYNNYGDVVFTYNLNSDKLIVDFIEINYNELQLPIEERHYKFVTDLHEGVRDYW